MGSRKLSEPLPPPRPPAPSKSVVVNVGTSTGSTTAVAIANAEIRRPVDERPEVSTISVWSRTGDLATCRPQCDRRSRSESMSRLM
jgi:hypothetical protein